MLRKRLQDKESTTHVISSVYHIQSAAFYFPILLAFFQPMPHLYVNAIRLCVFRRPLGLCAAPHLFICVICERII